MVKSVTELNSLQLYAFLSYLHHPRCCDVPKFDGCEHLTNWQYAALSMSFRANLIQSIRFMYFSVSVIHKFILS